MDIKKLLRNYTFWIAVASALFLLVQFVLGLFGVTITREGYMAAIDGVLSVFVILGVITAPPKFLQTDDDTQNASHSEEQNGQKDNVTQDKKSNKNIN